MTIRSSSRDIPLLCSCWLSMPVAAQCWQCIWGNVCSHPWLAPSGKGRPQLGPCGPGIEWAVQFVDELCECVPCCYGLQDVVEGRQCFFAGTPYVSWSCALAGSMILPRLTGYRKVHVLMWNEIPVPSLPALMRALSAGSGGPPLGPHARLEQLTVTVLDPHGLVFSGCSDFAHCTRVGVVKERLQIEAAALGIKLDFNVCILQEHNLDVLDTVHVKSKSPTYHTARTFGSIDSPAQAGGGGGLLWETSHSANPLRTPTYRTGHASASCR